MTSTTIQTIGWDMRNGLTNHLRRLPAMTRSAARSDTGMIHASAQEGTGVDMTILTGQKSGDM
jgi:hypothetical protein